MLRLRHTNFDHCVLCGGAAPMNSRSFFYPPPRDALSVEKKRMSGDAEVRLHHGFNLGEKCFTGSGRRRSRWRTGGVVALVPVAECRVLITAAASCAVRVWLQCRLFVRCPEIQPVSRGRSSLRRAKIKPRGGALLAAALSGAAARVEEIANQSTWSRSPERCAGGG